MKKILHRFLPEKEFLDLEGWRSYYVGAMLFLSLFIFPLGIFSSVGNLIAEGKLWLLPIEAATVFVLVFSFLRFRPESPPTKLYFSLLVGLTLLYLLVLGPLYARPGWLLLCAVSASLLFGTQAAIGVVAANALVLMLLYWFVGPHLASWADVYQKPFSTWFMFAVNLSFLALFASLPGGILLNQMNKILNREFALRTQLARESESLQSINEELRLEIAERKKAEDEKKRLQAELNHAQKMEAMGTLAGGIAHDFNNILAAIIGYSQLALGDPSMTIDTKRKIVEILNAGDRAKTLINQILTFSRKTEIRVQPLKLNDAVADALKMMRSLIPANIKVEQHYEYSGLVLSSSTYIHQIIMNLFNNAIHAMDKDGGVLAVGVSREFIDESPAGNVQDMEPGFYLKMTVSDTGCGMMPDIAARVFEPYFTTKDAGRGTGLGLSVVHGIVKSHSGAIVCNTQSGKGTSFDVYLPEIEERRDPEHDREETRLPSGTESILYVDDEPMLCEIACEMLESLGYRVVSKTSSVEAYDLFAENPGQFAAVITDMSMPKLTGEKLAQKIFALRPDLPIIICTGFSEHLSAEDARRLGIRDFLMKPYDMAQLAYSVRRAIDGEPVG